VIVGPQGIGDWSFRKGGSVVSVRVEGRLRIPVNERALAVAVADTGIVMTTLEACRQELASGALVRVLPEWDLGSAELHAVFIGGRAAKPSARAFAEFLSVALHKV
jgi:DNA-binding transcriptional LysR family regulator